ncbi:MAG: hypothetical protein WAW91_03200 [Candidatus Nanoperiomorbaceae bacterium]
MIISRKLRFNKIVRALSALIIAFALTVSAVVLPISSVSAADDLFGFQQYRGNGQPSQLFNGPEAIIPRIINIMLFIVGILAVIMLIYGGIRYVLSSGDAGRVKDAKNTVLYAIVGLVVAIFAYAIINWIIQTVGAGAGGGSPTV